MLSDSKSGLLKNAGVLSPRSTRQNVRMVARRRRGGGAPKPAGAVGPPGDPLYWWDAGDTGTMYSDDEATTLISGSDNDVVRAWTSKGTDTMALKSVGASDTNNTFNLVWQNGLPSIDADVSSTNGLTSPTHATNYGTGGWTVCCIFSTTNAELFSRPFGGTGDNATTLVLSDNPWGSFSGGGKRHTDHTVANNEVVCMILDHEGTSGDYFSRTSGSATALTGEEFFSDFETGGDVFGIQYSGTVATTHSIGEWIVWDGSLSDNGLTDEDIVSYIEDRWGITFAA